MTEFLRLKTGGVKYGREKSPRLAGTFTRICGGMDGTNFPSRLYGYIQIVARFYAACGRKSVGKRKISFNIYLFPASKGSNNIQTGNYGTGIPVYRIPPGHLPGERSPPWARVPVWIRSRCREIRRGGLVTGSGADRLVIAGPRAAGGRGTWSERIEATTGDRATWCKLRAVAAGADLHGARSR